MEEQWHYRAFSEGEHRRRVERGRQVMEDAGLAACVCTSPELIYYFTGYEAHTHHAIGSQALVLAADCDRPVLILRDGDLPQAEETLVIGDLRPFRLGAVELGDLVGEVVTELGKGGLAVGLDLSGPTMTGALSQAIRAALGDATLGDPGVSDCWRLLGALRTLLSLEEIAYLKQAARYADAGIDAFYGAARVGMSEIELAAEIEYAMRSAGSDYAAVPTWMASGARDHCQHAMASSRRFAAGDLVHAEFAGVARRYQCVTMGSLVLGEPTAKMCEMATGGIEAYEAGLRAAKLGARIGDMELAYRDCLAGLGLGDCCPMRFGVGISAAYPPVWENQITIQLECDEVLQPGMAFYIHASLQSFGDKQGMLLGGSYLMTEGGPERLDKAPLELVVLEG